MAQCRGSHGTKSKTQLAQVSTQQWPRNKHESSYDCVLMDLPSTISFNRPPGILGTGIIAHALSKRAGKEGFEGLHKIMCRLCLDWSRCVARLPRPSLLDALETLYDFPSSSSPSAADQLDQRPQHPPHRLTSAYSIIKGLSSAIFDNRLTCSRLHPLRLLSLLLVCCPCPCPRRAPSQSTDLFGPSRSE